MKTYKILFFSSLLLSFLLLAAIYANFQAAPMPPRLVINHLQRQCAQIVTGDECGDVILPPDWEYLDANSGEQCPAEYTFVDLFPDWIHFKASFCCTVGHSGSSGDCEDMVINLPNRKCAFVEDIHQCAGLPEGWEPSGKECPAEFAWLEDLTCINSSTPTAITLQTEPGNAVLEPSASPPSQTLPPTPSEKSNPMLPCASLGFGLIAFLGLRFL